MGQPPGDSPSSIPHGRVPLSGDFNSFMASLMSPRCLRGHCLPVSGTHGGQNLYASAPSPASALGWVRVGSSYHVHFGLVRPVPSQGTPKGKAPVVGAGGTDLPTWKEEGRWAQGTDAAKGSLQSVGLGHRVACFLAGHPSGGPVSRTTSSEGEGTVWLLFGILAPETLALRAPHTRLSRGCSRPPLYTEMSAPGVRVLSHSGQWQMPVSSGASPGGSLPPCGQWWRPVPRAT